MKTIKYFSLLLLILMVSKVQSQTFSNTTNILNTVPGTSNQPCAVDMNGDGLDDVVRIDGNYIRIDYQQTDGSFVQSEYFVNMQNHASWSIAAGDIDGNGYRDLAIGGGSQASFLYADDDGNGYSELAFPEYIFCQRSNFADIDNDGDLDAFICHDVDESHPYENDGNGNLTLNQSLISTNPVGGNYASIWVDFDLDNDLDLHIAKCRSGAAPSDPKRMNGLYRNNGDGTFTEMAAEVGLDDNDQSWVTVFEDLDNDGDFDAFTVNHAWSNILYEHIDNGNFVNVTPGSGINAGDLGSWACIGADFDNDGFVDFLGESNSNQELYHNNGDMTFTSGDLPFNKGALCDLNNDGFIDVFTGYTLWMNDGNDNNWIKFNLQGIVSNSDGIGTKIKIYGDWGVQIRESRSGESFRPASTRNIHFGIGSATEIDSVEVIWPSGLMVTEYNPEINNTTNLIEASCLFDAEDIVANGNIEFCEGESVILEAPTGYSYSWSNNLGSNQTITVSQSGNYSVVITDTNTGCLSVSNSISVNVMVPDNPSIVYDGSTATCASTPVSLEATPGISYLWSTGETTQTVQVNETGNYTVSVEGACGTLSSEQLSLVFNEVPSPIISSNTTLSEAGNLEITAEGDNLTWYSDDQGTDVLGTGNTINYDLTGNESIYIQSAADFPGANQLGGKLDFSGGGGLPSSGGGSTFNVWEPFTLNSVRVNALSPGVRTLNLVDENDNILETYTGDMDGEMSVTLNWPVPVGDNFQIRCVQNNLFRNNSGVTYPYPIGDVGQIHTSTFGDQYYYYFYNWQIQKVNMTCESELVEVEMTIVGIDELSQVSGLEIYPNPSSDNLYLKLDIIERLDLEIELINSLGQSVYLKSLGTINKGAHQETIDVSGLASGAYNLVIRSEGGEKTVSVSVGR